MQPVAPVVTRTRQIIYIMCALGAIFIVRLFYLQVIMHDHYENEAIEKHIKKFTIPAERGLVYVRDGANFKKIVLNEPVYTVYADPRYVKDENNVATVLRRIAGGNVVKNFEKGLANKELQYTVLARQVNKTQADLIKKEQLGGVGLQEEEKRVYPEGQLAAQVLGFVNGEGEGQYGIEQAFNDELAGKDGRLKAVTDVYGIPLSVGPENVLTPPQNGKNIVLTIDRNIQHKTEDALKAGLAQAKATKGSAIVINPNNGHILAMANFPSYDPNKYDQIEDYRLFENKIISDPYEPGSVVKALTMGVGLNEGVIQPDTTYVNTGSTQVADAIIKNVLTSPTGNISMTQVLEYSFNTGVVQVLRLLGGGEISQTGKQKLYQYFSDRYFLGRPTNVQLTGEVSGNIVPPSDADGGPVRYANMTFGQGMTATVLQVASAFSAAINGGSYYTPQIVAGHLAEGGTFQEKAPELRKADIISRAASDKLRAMLHQARFKSFVSAADKKGYVIGGKTGTAQVYDPKTGKYSETDTIGTYIGFGGQEKPEYVIMVRVDDATIGGFSGSMAAAPIFAEVSNWMIDYLQLQPKD